MLSKTSKGAPPLFGRRTNICDLGWKKSRFVLIHSLHKCKEDYHLIENILREIKITLDRISRKVGNIYAWSWFLS